MRPARAAAATHPGAVRLALRQYLPRREFLGPPAPRRPPAQP